MFVPSPYLICFSQLRGVPSTWFVPIPLVVHPLWRIFHLPGLGLFHLAPFLPLSWVHCVLLMIGKCSSTLEGKQAIQKIRKVQKENFPVPYPSIVPNRFWCWIQAFLGGTCHDDILVPLLILPVPLVIRVHGGEHQFNTPDQPLVEPITIRQNSILLDGPWSAPTENKNYYRAPSIVCKNSLM